MPRYCLCLTFVAVVAAGVSNADAGKPNVVILYADDMGFGDLGANNPASKIPTPNLDRLAAEGMRFTDGHSSSGICTPSRYALLTGRHHWRDFHGIVNAFGPSVFADERVTLPELLRSGGYATAAVGKWHLGWDWDAIRRPEAKQVKKERGRPVLAHTDYDWSKPIPDGPLAHGFDYYFGDNVINFPPYCWIENDRVLDVPDMTIDGKFDEPTKEGRWEARPGPMVSGWDFYAVLPTITDRAVGYIEERVGDTQPFFLYVPFPSPHAPIIPNDEFDGTSDAGPYGDFVVETDAMCGKILDALDAHGCADDTIVVFTADNGPEKYAYARDEKFGHWSAEPFRGLKRDIYEGGHHVPFLIKWPGVTEPGAVCDALVSQIDLMATLAAAAGLDLPAENAAEDSFDITPLLRGQASAVRDVHVHNTREGRYAIRVGDYVLVAAKDGYQSGRNAAWEQARGYPADDGGPVELFDVRKDVGQKTDLASALPEKVEELRALLDEILAGERTAP